jgi:hypothetical protein
MSRGQTVYIVLAILLSPIVVTHAVGQGVDSSEHLCRVVDVQAERCKKNDVLLVMPLPLKGQGQVSESAERIFVAVSVAQWCDLTRPIVPVSPVAVVCTYLGRTRGKREVPPNTP